MPPEEMEALLDVLEYEVFASFGGQDPGWWTWEQPGLEHVKLPLYRVRDYVRRWKGSREEDLVVDSLR